jgi:NAD(P)-dependent dehydrogenase (short-subunit alcohol dehydrogenase family)
MSSTLFDLTGKVAVITGSTRGIGRAIAEEMARAGAKVVISSRKADVCEDVAASIRSEGYDAIPIACNISKKEELENLVAETRKAYGKIDVLVCNAALNPYYGPMAGASDEVFTKIMAVNIQSNLWLCNMVLPEMAERKDGSVIIVSSIGGLKGSTVLGLYCISKAADFQLVRNLAVEWGEHNIRVNAIAPGLVKTDFAKALWDNPETLAKVEAGTPLRRIGESVDIAGAAVFLGSQAGAWMTGQQIVIDGGVTISG